jgi:[ribosomal protein S18]-alanine N-acetyltransferase
MTAATDVSFRTAIADDLPALLTLEAQFPGDRLSARQFRRHLGNPRACLRVLLAAGAIGGYALLLVRAGSEVARLYSIAIDPAMRGRGAGAALLSDAERQALRAGRARMRLEVRADNAAAIGLYTRAGYRQFATLDDYYEDGATALRFEKSLPAGS